MKLIHNGIMSWLVAIAFLGSVSYVYSLDNTFSSKKFDHFTYAQSWPPGACMNPIKNDFCVLPGNVSTWTVHGLWPSEGHTEYPQFCNKTSHFDPAQVSSIMADLNQFWPNLKPNETHNSFWEHEWSKHGTCASQMPDLNTQLKYFTRGLQLRESLQLYKVLAKKNIIPKKDTQYKVTDVREALADAFGNGSFIIECAYTQDPATQYIKAVQLCLSKEGYHLQACPPGNTSVLALSSKQNLIYRRLSADNNLSTMSNFLATDKSNEYMKCQGYPEFCECIDTLVYTPFDHADANNDLSTHDYKQMKKEKNFLLEIAQKLENKILKL